MVGWPACPPPPPLRLAAARRDERRGQRLPTEQGVKGESKDWGATALGPNPVRGDPADASVSRPPAPPRWLVSAGPAPAPSRAPVSPSLRSRPGPRRPPLARLPSVAGGEGKGADGSEEGRGPPRLPPPELRRLPLASPSSSGRDPHTVQVGAPGRPGRSGIERAGARGRPRPSPRAARTLPECKVGPVRAPPRRKEGPTTPPRSCKVDLSELQGGLGPRPPAPRPARDPDSPAGRCAYASDERVLVSVATRETQASPKRRDPDRYLWI